MVAEALTGLIYHRPLGENSNIPFHHFLPDDGRSISRNVANTNKLVQDKIKLFFQNILQLLITEHAHVTTESETHLNDGWQGGKVAAFYPRHARVAFRSEIESTKMAENKINIVVFVSSNALLDSLEISVIDHGIKLIQMVEEIVKDYFVDSILIENN